MRTPKLKLAVIAVAAAFAADAAAIDFLQTYRLARQNDPTFASARSGLEAGLEKLPQGRALLLPVINGTANTNWNEARNVTGNRDVNFNSNGYAVNLTQPLFRWQNIVQYKQSEFQVLQSEAQFGQATQDLIVRVAQAYFEVLAAQDNLDFIAANKIAIAEQLAQAKRNFEVGTATITDTNEAQARYDLAVAQEIAGQNALEVAVRALQQIIGQIPDQLTPLKAVAMTAPVPNVMDEWANAARLNNFVVRGNEAVFEIATREIERQRAGHYPTVDAVASYQDNTTLNPAAAFAGAAIQRAEVQQTAIGLQFTLPIFAGGSVLSRTREAVALREKARQDVEASKRAAEFNARQSYLNVTNGLAQVKALEQALVSSETSLQSNRVGYEVGVRINIDVLNAQQQVFQTKRDLARARYDTILNGLRLKSAAGSLAENDVELVNALLGFDPGTPPGPIPTQPLKPPTGMFGPAVPAAAAGAKAAEPAAAKTAPEAAGTKRASAQASKEKSAAAGKPVASTKTATARAEPTPPAAPVVAPVAASPAPVEKPLETPAQEPVAARVPAEEHRPAESATVPVVMQPSPGLEKALPAAEAVPAAPPSKTTAKKESATPKTKKPSVATQATAPTVASVAPAAPAAPTADEPPARVYSVVEPTIPGIRRAAADEPAAAPGPAAEPKQD